MLRLIFLSFLVVVSSIHAQEGLRYRMQLWMHGDPQPLETRFRLQSTAGTRSHNRVQKPRMGGWHLEVDRSQGTPYAQAASISVTRMGAQASAPFRNEINL